jgi:hypothetical protein
MAVSTEDGDDKLTTPEKIGLAVWFVGLFVALLAQEWGAFAVILSLTVVARSVQYGIIEAIERMGK